MGGEDVVGEVKGVEEVGVGFACRGARSRGDRRSEIEVDPKRRGLRERKRRLLLSWAKAGKDSKESREATRSEGDKLEESAARAPLFGLVALGKATSLKCALHPLSLGGCWAVCNLH
jgi:hypothetical protein